MPDQQVQMTPEIRNANCIIHSDDVQSVASTTLQMNTCARILTLLFSCTALWTSSAFAFDWWPTPYTLDIEWSQPIENEFISVTKYVPVPGADEFLLVGGGAYGRPYSHVKSRYIIYDAAHKSVGQLNLESTLTYASGVDIDRDGVKELMVSFINDTSAGLRAYKWPSLATLWEYTLLERDFRFRGTAHWDITIEARAVVDTPTVSQPNVLLMIREGYARLPSGLVMLDARTGEERWHYWIASGMDGGFPFHLIGTDDGSLNIVGGTSACCNGATYDGISDDHSYVFCVDVNGNLRWLHDIPVRFSLCIPYPATVGTNNNLITLCIRGGPDGEDQLRLIDRRTGALKKCVRLPDAGKLRQIEPWNKDTDGGERWLISANDSRPLLCDSELRLQPVANVRSGRIYGNDLDGDGILEGLCNTVDGSLEVRDSQFRLMARTDEKCTGSLILKRKNRKWADIYASDHQQVYCFALRQREHYGLAIAGRIAAAGGLLLLMGFGPVWTWRARRACVKARREREQTRAWAAVASKLAHDIRTPVSVLQLSGYNLEQELELEYGRIPDHIRKYFAVIRQEATRTESAAKSMLKFARVEKPILEPVPLAELIIQTVDSYPHASDLQIRYDIEAELPTAWVDRQQFVSLIENLVSNSIKAMKGKGILTVHLRKAQELPSDSKEVERFELVIEDTGCGISKQDLPRVFEPYFSHSQGGTGLGMVIVRKIVEDHQGTIHLASEVGAGTTVSIRMPFRSGGADV